MYIMIEEKMESRCCDNLRLLLVLLAVPPTNAKPVRFKIVSTIGQPARSNAILSMTCDGETTTPKINMYQTPKNSIPFDRDVDVEVDVFATSSFLS